MTKPRPAPQRARLRDGSRVLLRALDPGDKAQLQAGLARLSERSRYQRFLGPLRAFSERQLRYLTEIDYDDHMAWGALDLAPARHPRGLGVARYVRLPEDPKVAELAVAVVDSHHGRGLGTLLLAALSRSAAENGIESFLGYVLSEDQPVLRIARRWGAQVSRDREGLIKVLAPVPELATLPPLR